MPNTTDGSSTKIARYSKTAMALHWISAILLLTLFGVGLYMSDLGDAPNKMQIYNWHKWGGITFLVLSALRLIWRFVSPPPELPSEIKNKMSKVQSALYKGSFFLFYALFFAIPLLGWAMSNAWGYPVVWFNLIPLPNLVSQNIQLAQIFGQLHEILAWAIIVLFVFHVLAVIQHHVMDRYPLLRRMLPW